MARVFTDGGAQSLTSDSQKLIWNDDWSIAFWLFRTATPAATRGLFGVTGGTTDGFYIQLMTTNVIQAAQVYTTDKIRASSTAPTLNAWTHVVIAHKNTGLANTDFTFYFNGKSEAGTAIQTAIGSHTNGAQPIAVGNGVIGTLLAPPASIGPVAFWNRAISPAEALGLAGGMHPARFKEGLVEMFDMAAATGEEGWLAKLYLTQGATNPTSAKVSPAVESYPTLLEDTRLNVRPAVRSRARYAVLSSGVSHAIVGAVTVVASPASTVDFTRHASTAGAVTTVVTPAASLMDVTRHRSEVGAVTTAVTPAASLMDVTRHYGEVGADTVIAVPSATLLYTPVVAGAAIVGSVSVAITPSAGFAYQSAGIQPTIPDVRIGAGGGDSTSGFILRVAMRAAEAKRLGDSKPIVALVERVESVIRTPDVVQVPRHVAPVEAVEIRELETVESQAALDLGPSLLPEAYVPEPEVFPDSAINGIRARREEAQQKALDLEMARIRLFEPREKKVVRPVSPVAHAALLAQAQRQLNEEEELAWVLLLAA